MEAATQPQASAKPPAHMLNEVGNFIHQYLVCSDQQAALLAVWVLHTWCYRAFPVTPYLNIQSPGPQSGKTLCLRLLQLLSPPGSWYISSPASTPFMKKLLALKPEQSSGQGPELDLPPAVFLDDREFTIGSSGHGSIIHFLSSGAQAADRYLHQVDRSPRLHEVSAFCPKAFAGIDSLPPKLARHCLPVLLQRRKSTENVQPLDRTAALYAKPLTAWMQQWSQENFKRLAARAQTYSMELSTRYTPHDNQLCKPLLLIAQCLEGKWLENVGNSLQRVLGDRDPNLTCEGLQLLVDLCRVFRENSNPPYIPTRHLIPYLRGLDGRPWSEWGRAPDVAMARLLRPFGITSQPQRISADSVIKVYRLPRFRGDLVPLPMNIVKPFFGLLWPSHWVEAHSFGPGKLPNYATRPADLSLMAAGWQHQMFRVFRVVSALFRVFFAKSPIKMRFVSGFRDLGHHWQTVRELRLT